ncbi:MAG: FIST C-terminal domain-containing protein [Actinobacteria bacterium]|nr:FIST C-terminal domain-containing protein [Actinomycetota bacterium]
MKAISGSWSTDAGWSPPPAGFADGSRDGGSQTLVMFFAEVDSEVAARAIAELSAALPHAVTVGCSSAGIILGDGLCTDGITAVAMHFESVTPRVATADVAQFPSSREVGNVIGDALTTQLEPGQPGTVFVLADGLVVNGTALVSGLSERLPAGVGISGGLAGDGDRFDRTWVYSDGQVHVGAVVAVGLASDRLSAGYGSAGGWEGFGPFRLVTQSDHNVLHSLDGRPALTLYKEYLGDRAEQLPASALLFPLLIRSPDASVELVRTVLAVNEVNSTLTFAGDIPEGWTARLMRATLDRLVDAAGVAAEEAGRDRPDPDVVIAVSCVGRRLVLGQRTDEEVEAAVEVLGTRPLVIGFYSYGEISPTNGTSELHNQTMTLTTLTESAG